MSRNIAFSRPATYNPALVKKTTTGDDDDELARRQQLKEELGLTDDDDRGDMESSRGGAVSEWRQRCDEAMAKLQVALENEEKAQSSLSKLQLLSKSQTAILKTTFDKKLKSKESMVHDLLHVIADHESKLKRSGIPFEAYERPTERDEAAVASHDNDALASLKAQVEALADENTSLRKKLAAAATLPMASAATDGSAKSENESPHLLKKIASLEMEKQSLIQLLKDAQLKLSAHKAAATKAAAPRDIADTPPPPAPVVVATTDEYKDLERKLAKVEGELKKANQKVEAAEREIATLKSTDTSPTDRVKLAEAEAQLAAVTAMMHATRKELEESFQAKHDKLKQAAEADLAKLKDQAKKSILDLRKKLESNSRSSADMSARLARAKTDVAKHKAELKALRGDVGALVAMLGTVTKDMAGKIESRVKAQTDALAGVVDNYKREMKERKRLFNMVQELQGNIRVLCRFRPISKNETANGCKVVTKFTGHEEVSVVGDKGKSKSYEFEHVFDMHSTQDHVFAQVKPLITSVMDGFNVCIFAYGQTGSGKTFTMSGSADNPGINPRALHELFGLKHTRTREFYDDITVSIMEIYNEVIRDLLADNAASTYVPLESEAADVFNLIAKGNQNRSTHATDMNEHSSRSHSILSIYVKSTNVATNVVANGKVRAHVVVALIECLRQLHLVDLAGSERLSKTGAEGQRLKEAQNINQSLSTLGNVIQARANKQKHVPYRDSSLTYLLQDSLGGDSKTLMVACSSPVDYNAEETFCTLNFASRARCVEMGKATKHVAKPKE
ncbi:hypothetical protein DYB32_004358 [Aphanomyces invadans]|uniref:Kinesin motor domain-containing protein n=1 Tax=Aphanomyces invadans TaxID=157072 RepID=A0A3R6ZR46_9STRA|nr:hypothetical protein DYB32_004358 [Aphanomyces invadans]